MYTYPKSGMGISVFIPMPCFFEVRQYGVLHQAAFHGDIEVLRQLLEDYKANVKLLTKAEKCDAMWGHRWITTQYIMITMITMIYLLHKIPRLSFLVPSVFRCSQGMRRSQNVWINLPKALENLNRAIFHSAKRSCIEDGKTALQIAESAGQEAAIKYLEAGHKRCTSHCNEFPLLLATHECNKVQTSGWAMGRITTKQSSKANQRMLVVKHHSW